MPDYYADLEVDSTATLSQIKESYRRLAKTYHPDKSRGMEALFLRIQEAYQVLSNPEKRCEYDDSLEEIQTDEVPDFTIQPFDYVLPPNPCDYNYYDYVNRVLKLAEPNRLVAGQKINHPFLFEKLGHITTLLSHETMHLDFDYHFQPTRQLKEQRAFIRTTIEMIEASRYVLCIRKEEKTLYDFAIGAVQSDELAQVTALIGGMDILNQYIKKDPIMHATPGIRTLKRASLLSQANFKKLTRDNKYAYIWCEDIARLDENGLLTQENFDRLLKFKHKAYDFSWALFYSCHHEYLNQNYLNILFDSGKNLRRIASATEELYGLNILNENTFYVIHHQIANTEVWRKLLDIHLTKCINSSHTDAFHWSGDTQSMKNLSAQVNKLVAHGLYILSEDANIGLRTMMLGLELKKELKAYSDKNPPQQRLEKEQFTRSFIEKLHAEDGLMTKHRKLWKVIVANILIALSGIGLIALGINLAINNHCFFSQTRRSKLIDGIENACPPLML